MVTDSTQLDRAQRLHRFFNEAIKDSSKTSQPRHAALFIEAITTITTNENVIEIVDKLHESRHGFETLKQCIRQDLSPQFINGPAAHLLELFSSPSLSTIDSGTLLKQLIRVFVEPKFFWNACTRLLRQQQLGLEATRGIGWLLSEILRLFSAEEVEPFLDQETNNALTAALRTSESLVARELSYKIQDLLNRRSNRDESLDTDVRPGGRHDNDYSDIKSISIFPTKDEILSQQQPFLRTAAEVFDCEDVQKRLKLHIDNLFRLYREDMIYDLREEIQSINLPTRKYNKGLVIRDLAVAGVNCNPCSTGPPRRTPPWSFRFVSQKALPGLERVFPKDRLKYLKDFTRHGGGNYLRQGSFVAIQVKECVVAFGHINRNPDDLASNTPSILVQVDIGSMTSFLQSGFQTHRVTVIQVDTAVFAYEPFLRRLQKMEETPLHEELLSYKVHKLERQPASMLERQLEVISDQECDLGRLFHLQNSIVLDRSQHQALLNSLSQRVSIIQGPPGTGKSFIGALIARTIHDWTTKKILVVCFTNHALDQFVGDLRDIGIPDRVITRFGSKLSERNECLKPPVAKLNKAGWNAISRSRQFLEHAAHQMPDLFSTLAQNIKTETILDHLEFGSDSSLKFFDAFHPPQDQEDDMQIVGQSGRRADSNYLFKRWRRGARSSGLHRSHGAQQDDDYVWQMSIEERERLVNVWTQEIRDDPIARLALAGTAFSECCNDIKDVFVENEARSLADKRIIACTSNFAAKHFELLNRLKNDVLLLEEAGELLEAHVVTSLTSHTKQLIMIGDHQQLRPKISNHRLSVEKGDGFDLNRSLFERMVIGGHPHITLTKQHRMRPEISDMVRHLTYAHLEDAGSVEDRSNILGLRKNVVFINHREPELAVSCARDLQHGGSKENIYEARYILKCVRYLVQQGYTSEDIVVLTPYLGQLRLLRDTLKQDSDPVLNEMDMRDLRQAGLLESNPLTRPAGRKVYISSIDNYQGQERRIVLVSLTRSNSTGDIGFMSQPERLNVLLSRARDGLIVVANLTTFTSAKKGSEVWKKLVNYLNAKQYVFPGLPIYCQSHPHIQNLPARPEDFATMCPDGGCTEPCSELLACGKHKCPSCCHILVDHSNIRCEEVITERCSKGHEQKWRCHAQRPSSCSNCEAAERLRKKRDQEALKRQQDLEAQARAHDDEMQDLDRRMAQVRGDIALEKIDAQMALALRNKRRDLEALEATRIHDPADEPSDVLNPDARVASVSQSEQVLHQQTSQTTRDQERDNMGKRIIQTPRSAAREEWERQKLVEAQYNMALDELMDMIGLEEVKGYILKIKSQVELSKRQDVDMSRERFHVAFLGNPGTGKTTVARYWAKLLHSLEVLSGDGFVETTGSKLANDGINGCESLIQKLLADGGGAFFLDEAYQLSSGSNAGGKSVLDFLLGEIENKRGQIVFVFAGYEKEMETFFGHNPGIPSRIPHSFKFHDYDEPQLMAMLQKLFRDKYNSRAVVQKGMDGLYVRIVVRRLARQRGNEGFGNMRDLENVFSGIRNRQATRVALERQQGKLSDDFLFTSDDLIGPAPSQAVQESSAWRNLHKLIGLKAVKDEIKSLIDRLDTNYNRELREKQPIDISLNKVFLGSPGTGKTTVAKLYGQLLADMGYLTNGDVVCKTPADFIGSALGGSEANTSAILEASKGKVLIIDEAYMLDPNRSEGGSVNDPYRTAVIDTLVSKVHSVPGDNRCVLLLGYENEMQRMYNRTNPGFPRRFPLNTAFRFEDFSSDELMDVLEMKLRDQDLTASEAAKRTARDVLTRARNSKNFGNAGEVENLITSAKQNHQKRVRGLNGADFEFTDEDFDPDCGRSASASVATRELFKDSVGSEALVEQLLRIQNVAIAAKSKGGNIADYVPMSFIFKGPPGTGKTTTARKMGKIYYDMGLLARPTVHECSASDLVAEYVGQTGPKTRRQLERGLGQVLFIDEAYRLSEGHYATEAVNELVDLLTKPEFKGKLIVILAGYEDEMDGLLTTNPGLSSRFPETLHFKSLTAVECMKLLQLQLQRSELKCTSLELASSLEFCQIEECFQQLVKLKRWGNGRDIENISKRLIRTVWGRDIDITAQSDIIHQDVVECLQQEILSRTKSEGQLAMRVSRSGRLPANCQTMNQKPPPPPKLDINIATEILDLETAPSEEVEGSAVLADSRDEGVTDDVWRQLQADRAAAEQRELRSLKTLQRLKKSISDIDDSLTRNEDALKQLQAAEATDEDEDNDSEANEKPGRSAEIRQLLAEREAARIKRGELLDKQAAEEQQREVERRAQQKLREMGVCPMGFRWIKQAGGYRCAGGSHFVDDAQLGL